MTSKRDLDPQEHPTSKDGRFGEFQLYARSQPFKNEWGVEAYIGNWEKAGEAEFVGVREYLDPENDPHHATIVALKGWNVEVKPKFRRKGLATAMYEFAAEAFQLPIYPGDFQTPEGRAFLTKETPMIREPAPFATAEVRHAGWSYSAVMYDEWAGSYAGAARRTEYFRYDGEWKPIPWDAVPKPAYRQLRAMLRDPAHRTLDEENAVNNPRLARALIEPYLDESRRGRLTRSTARPGTAVRVADSNSMYRGWTGTVVTPDARRLAALSNYERQYLLRGGSTVLIERPNGELFVQQAHTLERLGEAITRAMARDSRRGPRGQR